MQICDGHSAFADVIQSELPHVQKRELKVRYV